MKSLIEDANKSELSKNQSYQIDEQLKKLYSAFDTDKNGLLDLIEIISALSILCKGSIPAKLNCLQSVVLSEEDAKEGVICFKELKRYFLCVFSIALQTNKEVIITSNYISCIDFI